MRLWRRLVTWWRTRGLRKAVRLAEERLERAKAKDSDDPALEGARTPGEALYGVGGVLNEWRANHDMERARHALNVATGMSSTARRWAPCPRDTFMCPERLCDRCRLERYG